ncbi:MULTISPECIES: DUF2267 domain-containing protein [unclassified Pseudonocardia]|uniref:DUF2267 domain-containing protein n=1 Tax=unclassified Pseudonocardia TaxID=2619320 RepID=UPI00094B691F|nr:DUF2267 domain-containing protein [Pseudonocardia sp. Ae707_Ps1]
MSANDPHPADSTPGLDAFVARVRDRAGVDTASEAEALARATFRRLGEQISRGEAEKLAPALPTELSSELLAQATGQARGFDRRTFVDAVSGATGDSDIEQADARVAAVLGTLDSWADLSDTVEQLPDGLAAMVRAR